MIITVDLETDDFDALNTAAVKILGELERRRVLEESEQQIDQINTNVQQALGRSPGDPWVQPLGAHDSYPLGWEAPDEGKLWESTVSGNVWKPGVSGWREVVEEGGAPPEWVQPTGGHDAYNKGDQVTFAGDVYESNLDGNTWSPVDYPAGWTLIE